MPSFEEQQIIRLPVTKFTHLNKIATNSCGKLQLIRAGFITESTKAMDELWSYSCSVSSFLTSLRRKMSSRAEHISSASQLLLSWPLRLTVGSVGWKSCSMDTRVKEFSLESMTSSGADSHETEAIAHPYDLACKRDFFRLRTLLVMPLSQTGRPKCYFHQSRLCLGLDPPPPPRNATAVLKHNNVSSLRPTCSVKLLRLCIILCLFFDRYAWGYQNYYRI